MDYKRRYSNSVLNLTPLIDVVFLLLVFFMLTAHFVDEESMAIDLPQASSGTTPSETPYVNVILGADDSIRIDAEIVAEEMLMQRMRSALEAPDKRRVRLRGDTQSQLGLAVKVIDYARSAGAESVDIMTEQP